MPVRILAIGDVVGRPGRQFLRDHLADIVAQEQIDLVIANGENAAGGLGITRAQAADLHRSGVHVITTGDHVWRRADVRRALIEDPLLLRPLNFPAGTVGEGVGWLVRRNHARRDDSGRSCLCGWCRSDIGPARPCPGRKRLSGRKRRVRIDHHPDAE